LSTASGYSKSKNFAGVITAWFAVMLLLITFWLGVLEGDSSRLWTIYLATTVVAVVSLFVFYAIRYQSRHVDFFHPLFYALWFFYIPQIWFSALYYSDEKISLELPSMAMLWDRNEAFRYALLVTLVGTIAFGLGFIMPFGARLGRKFPKTEILQGSIAFIKVPLQNLFLIGMVAQIILFLGGVKVLRADGGIWQFSGVFQFLSFFFTVAVFVAWYAYFQKENGWGFIRFVFVALVILELLTRGSRGSLFQAVLLIFAAYQYSHFEQPPARFLKRITLIWAPVVIFTLLFGFYFGSAIRSRVYEENISQSSVSDLLLLSSDIISRLSQSGGSEVLDESLERLTERSRTGLISLSVVLTYAEVHRAEEIALGVDNKIIKDFINVFIPRFLVPERATIGDNRHIGRIYYGQSRNDPGQTMFGDLFREFGWAGLVIGMGLLGVTYRTLYVWLIEQPGLSPLRAAIFYLVIAFVNYENQYSQFYPILSRLFIFIAILLISLSALSSLRNRFR
jgi:hypothetical protein